MTAAMQGGCQCGRVRFAAAAAPSLVALCHCGTCRRAHAAPAVAWAMFAAGDVAITGTPARFDSSPGVARHFCAHCGTPFAFTADYLPGLIDLAVGAFDEPAALRPALQYWDRSRLPWMPVDALLDSHAGFPPPP